MTREASARRRARADRARRGERRSCDATRARPRAPRPNDVVELAGIISDDAEPELVCATVALALRAATIRGLSPRCAPASRALPELVRCMSASALGFHPSQAATGDLLAVLLDGSDLAEVRGHAAEALAHTFQRQQFSGGPCRGTSEGDQDERPRSRRHRPRRGRLGARPARRACATSPCWSACSRRSGGFDAGRTGAGVRRRGPRAPRRAPPSARRPASRGRRPRRRAARRTSRRAWRRRRSHSTSAGITLRPATASSRRRASAASTAAESRFAR